jgi:hypothetical protein
LTDRQYSRSRSVTLKIRVERLSSHRSPVSTNHRLKLPDPDEMLSGRALPLISAATGILTKASTASEK